VSPATLGAEAIVQIWERGRREHPVDRALTILAVLSERPRRELAEISVERRDSLLLAWRSRLFGDSMAGYASCPRCDCGVDVSLTAAGLDATYLAYLEKAPAESLAVVNLMSLLGLHRQFRGAAIGHFASTEITSSPGSRRLAEALQRLNAPPECVGFYREHVEADAVHEQVVRNDVVGDLVAREPHLDRDVVFGIRAHAAVEDRLADVIMASWKADETSLLRPLG